MCRWLVMSHTRTVPSPLPVARIVPSGLNATEPSTAKPMRRITVVAGDMRRRMVKMMAAMMGVFAAAAMTRSACAAALIF